MIAVASIFKNEARYIQEWIDHHRSVGVDLFYLFDNGSSDGGPEVVRGEADVQLIDLPGASRQLQSVAQAVLMAESDGVDWLASIDLDEYLAPGEPWTSVEAVLPPWADCVAPRWLMFGTGGHEAYEPLPTMVRFVRRASRPAVLGKSIVRPSRVNAQITSAHEIGVTGRTYIPPVDELALLHYWTRSVDECREKFDRGMADRPDKRSWDQFEASEEVLNETLDLSFASRFVPSMGQERDIPGVHSPR